MGLAARTLGYGVPGPPLTARKWALRPPNFEPVRSVCWPGKRNAEVLVLEFAMAHSGETKRDPTFLDGLTLVHHDPGFTCYPWDVTPTEYLAFAREELRHEDPRSCINVISHAKRAIHAQVDFLLYNCGRCLRSAAFPVKLELLELLGIVAPSILGKYNRLRNLMEHEYVTPSHEQAEDVADIAELFLKATLWYGRPLPTNLTFLPPDERGACTIECDWDERQIVVVSSIEGISQFGVCSIDAEGDPDLWMAWVAKILRLMQEKEDPYTKCKDTGDKQR